MKRVPALAVLAFVMVGAAGCGGHSSNTSLRITVFNGPRAHAFTLGCDPPGGSAPQPASICAELRRSPEMLSRGRAVADPCRSPAVLVRRGVRVKGRYRGKPVDTAFSVGGCNSPTGQGAAPEVWWILMLGSSV